MRKAFMASDEGTPTSLAGLFTDIAVHVKGHSQYGRFQKLYANDRIAFVHDCLPELAQSIAPYQEEVLGYYDSGSTRVSIRGPHGLGKTTLAAVLVHHSVLTAENGLDTKVPTTASAWRQLENYLWPEVHKVAKWIDWSKLGRPAYTRFELLTQKIRMPYAEAFALASDDHTTLEGCHAVRIAFIFDEAKTIPIPTWDAMEGAFSTEGLEDHIVLVFAISTPGDPSGRFYDIHMQKPGLEDWHTRHVTIQEAVAAGRVSNSWVERRRRQWGEDSSVFQNRVLGEFADESETGVIPLRHIHIAIDRYKAWEEEGRPDLGEPSILGVDVARFGGDATVLAERNALCLSGIRAYRKTSTTAAAGYVALKLDDYKANIEGDAMGNAVYDILREQGHRNISVIAPGGKCTWRDQSGKLEFLNNRAGWWWNMRELLDPRNGHEVMLPPVPRLISDLSAPQWFPNSRGVIQIESKDDLRKRLGYSTDYGDACCLAFWAAARGGGVVF